MNRDGPRISVVIPFHNAEPYLEACLRGVLSQTIPRGAYEVILVDNNSTDASEGIARTFESVAVLREPVEGSYAARNAGIRASRGSIVATLDPDCTPAPDWLAQIERGMSDPECRVILGRQKHAGGSIALRLLEMYETEKISYVTARKEKALYFGYTNNMAFRRHLFDEIGLFQDVKRGGDTVFVRNVVDRYGCDAVRFNPDVKVTHLEVDSLGTYYRKRLIYGQSNERISKLARFRHLTNRERWQVFRGLARQREFPPGRMAMLLALLAPGVLLYELGRRRGMRSRS